MRIIDPCKQSLPKSTERSVWSFLLLGLQLIVIMQTRHCQALDVRSTTVEQSKKTKNTQIVDISKHVGDAHDSILVPQRPLCGDNSSNQ